MQLRLTVRRSARNAAQVIALSEHTRTDLINTYKLRPEKVNVVPLAAPAAFAPVRDDNELQRVRQTYGIDRDYILSVGSIQPRKNLRRLIEAYSVLRRGRTEGKLPQLVLVGKNAWLFEETFRSLKDMEVGVSVILTGYVPESDLPALYSGALCFVYPSYFEGFGLPPLEAMKCGAPVIVGNKTSLPEVVGEAALMIDPFDVNAIAGAIQKMISDSDLRAELRVKGLKRAAHFNWKETARQTLAVYERAFSLKRNDY
jgi:glycosyltransferase involved in cell wall biosynthesis